MPHQLASLAHRYWFYLLLPVLLLASWRMSASVDWRFEARASEAALLFDWCLFVPVLYALYLRPLLPIRAVLLRTMAMACAGLWFAQLLAPDTAESMLVVVAPLRWVGLAILPLCEALLFAALLRLAFAERPDMTEMERHGLPRFVVRLMVLEARFWRWVWLRLRGR